MSEMVPTDGGRTEPKRFTESIDADELIEGDRVAVELIPRNYVVDVGDNVSGYSTKLDPTGDDDRTFDVRLVAHGYRDQYQNVQSALVYDPEAELFIRLTGHSNSGAMSRKERAWTVREIGKEVIVEDVWDIEIPDIDDFDETPEEFVKVWTSVVFDMAMHGDDITNELVKYDDKKFTLRDADGRSARIHYSLG